MNLLKNHSGFSLWVRSCENHTLLKRRSAWPFFAKTPGLIGGMDVEDEQLKCNPLRAVLKNPQGAEGAVGGWGGSCLSH